MRRSASGTSRCGLLGAGAGARALKPDVFIGIDAPDFNLGISKKLHAAGLKTIQFVAPTVWAWKQHRVKGLRKNLDLVLSIYPFEEAFLQEHKVPATYVGHPLADEIPGLPGRDGARANEPGREGDTITAAAALFLGEPVGWRRWTASAVRRDASSICWT